MKTAQQLLNDATMIRIVSGEGEQGNVRAYTGKRSVRAIKSRLTRERCGGDRWARVELSFDDTNKTEAAAKLSAMALNWEIVKMEAI